MRIEIEIPKEFEEHFKQNKFKDSFGRIMEEIGRNLRSRYCSYAGRYEYETIEMLQKAFENSRQAYPVEKVVEKLELHSFEFGTDTLPAHYVRLNDATKIVKQGGVPDDVCEWRLCDEEANVYDTSCRNPHILIEGTPKENNYEYCPYCGKKIKAGEDNANKI